MRKPWFREQNETWYAHFAGKQVRLVKGKDQEEEAYRIWNELKTASNPDAPNAPIAAICEAFLEWATLNLAEKTVGWYGDYLADLCSTSVGAMPVRILKPFHITKWLNDHGWKDAQRRAGITSIKRALNWACDEGLLQFNPIARMKRPDVGRREVTVAEVSHRQMIEAADQGHANQYRQGAFRLFLIGLRHAGCRPGELRTVTAGHYEPRAAIWKFAKHKTASKTKKPRIVHLTPCLDTISRILSHYRPDGPLFLNSEGNPWTANAIRCRMQRLREKLGLPAGTVSYSYRHTFATEGLLQGVNIATMAELLGHQDTKMISQHYGHLDQHSGHLKDAVARANTRAVPPPPTEP